MLLMVLLFIILLIGSFLTFVFSPEMWSFSLFLSVVVFALASIVLSHIAGRKVSVEILAGESVTKGKDAQFSFVLDNKSFVPFMNIRIKLVAENWLTGENHQITKKISLPAKTVDRHTFFIASPHCGEIKIRIEEIRLYDFFSLAPLVLKRDESKTLAILPETFDMEVSLPLSMSITGENEHYSPLMPGNDPAEVFQIRDYKEGDSLKQINWKMTAKTERLVVKDASLPIDKNVLIFWERSSDGESLADLEDGMMEVLVSLCRSLLTQGVLCRVFWNDKQSKGIGEITLQSESDLYENLPMLLRAGTTGNESGAEMFLSFHGTEKGGKVIYIGSYESSGCMDLASADNLNLLIVNTNDYAERYSSINLY